MRGSQELVRDSKSNLAGYHATITIPNLHVRALIVDVCNAIVDTTTSAKWTTEEADAFALGYVRGVLTALQAEDNPATAEFARALLAQVNADGVAFVRKLLKTVAGA